MAVTYRQHPMGADQGLQIKSALESIIGHSNATERVRNLIRRVAPTEIPVLVAGETGVGKELVARALHEEGPRRDRPFVTVNAGALGDSLLDSEIFGHERGAFTGAEQARRGLFEEAADGTILLDEIGDVPARLQVGLLRVLENNEVRPLGSNCPRKVRCRVIAATNADLADLVARGAFRADLYYRLSRIVIAVPPLRERKEDIPLLAAHFLGRAGIPFTTVSPEALETIMSYSWPGNIRELRNAMERAALLSSGTISPSDLAIPSTATISSGPAHRHRNDEPMTLVDFAATNAPVTAALCAEALHLSLRTVQRQLRAAVNAGLLKTQGRGKATRYLR